MATAPVSAQVLRQMKAAVKAAESAVAYKEGLRTGYEYALQLGYAHPLAGLIYSLEGEVRSLARKEEDGVGYSPQQRARYQGRRDGLEAVLQLLRGEREHLPLF